MAALPNAKKLIIAEVLFFRLSLFLTVSNTNERVLQRFKVLIFAPDLLTPLRCAPSNMDSLEVRNNGRNFDL